MGVEKRARQKAHRAAKRAAEARQKRRQRWVSRLRTGLVLGALILGTGLLLSRLFDDSDETSPTPTEPGPDTTTAAATTTSAPPGDTEAGAADYEAFRAQPVACGAQAPPLVQDLSFTAPVDLNLGDDPITAVLDTSCGPIQIELDPALAPETVNSFVFLAQQGYFDGSAFHRVVPGFMIQGGDPTATGTGGPGYSLPDELPADDFTYVPGTVAMANAGPNTSGSQFFIVVGDASHLGPDFSVLGQIVDGFEALDAIAAVPLGNAPNGELSRPLETVYLERIEVGTN
ncbi:MAG: peptidylprolyl isomerase [Acidimicrobiia bacterium]